MLDKERQILPASVWKLQLSVMQQIWLWLCFVKPRFTDHSVAMLRGVTQDSSDEQFLFTTELMEVLEMITKGEKLQWSLLQKSHFTSSN